MESASSPLRYRKNGRLQACDPCRRRKVACDHARPVCSNCKRRRRTEPCEFTMSAPAQMRPDPGGPRAVSERTSRSASVSPGSEMGAERSGRQYQPATASTLVDRRSEISPVLTETETPVRRAPSRELGVADGGSGHLGFMSWSDVYREVGNGLSGHDVHAEKEIRFVGRETRSQRETIVFAEDARTLETCLSVLRQVPDEREGRQLFNSQFDPHNAFIHPVAVRALDSLYGTFGHYLGTARDDAQLSEFARRLCYNSSRPFFEHEPDPELWMAQFTRENLRWETLGLLFIYWEMKLRNEQLPRTEVGRMGYGQKNAFRKCIFDCITLARQANDVGNTLLLYLYFRRMIIESIIDGDTSRSTWMTQGETVSLLTFLGLHVEQNKGPYKPTLASELRRRVLVKIFVLDKVGSAITGRPPALSRRYILTPIPLDIRDDYLLGDDETISKAVRSLDKSGWNADGALNSVTFWRARYQLMIIRDEIFEVALGPEAAISVEVLLALKAKEFAAAAEMPTIMRFKESDIRNPSLTGQMFHVRLLMQLEHLQNLFFIERLLHRQDCSNKRELLSVSYEMTSTTLLFWTDMDSLGVLCEDFKWLVLAYAAPGGGILCLELLKPTLTLANSGVTVTDSNGKVITRSSIVQVLSLLVGFLKWVSPSEATGGICASTMTIVQQVLDEALNGAPNSNPSGDAMEWDFSAQLDFNFDLLDTYEWMRPEFSWTDLPAQG
ncbi:hypothetical protein CORC01_13124 [Colletotrichum orchidophilum]|uniref:Zn(2)-C6 fungal-type domain-containing protein n=1 Tax=Colletotrichum orchidophilum TaxID=1209926 RepID=A0A1G4AR48_9PEZI|nr:uncharacterized protein CORC01_13124 [Colletotrichum orchidophilum]OHE91576.1 hypothetical protein CORC01_13124 [Colletotrichum orchidophilum]